MFTLKTTDGLARRGKLQLAHGEVETPIFMPVGTVGSVKSLTNPELKNLGAQIILGNTYHLFLRPGMEVIRHFGGLHKFIGWDRPMLSDSGGFQIFSLSKLNQLSEEGAHFCSHLDGSKFLLSPEDAVNIQETLGTDIHMVLDECTPYPASEQEARRSMERSIRWAKRCRDARTRMELFQFGIVQGGVYPHLRQECAHALMEIDFDGYSIGGLSVGEPKAAMREMTEAACQVLPPEKPRYLMGVGTPLDLIESVALGVDMFDCVMPTRNGRNGYAFTSLGPVSIKQKQHQFDDAPLDPNCTCHACTHYSRGYLRHLFKAGELTVMRLLSEHNLTFYLKFMADIRHAIEQGEFDELLQAQRRIWQK
ncbi:MAG: tRNA guanosine(34) transglycosylase Tgt [Zetaproteobacteria bacterium]|nr:tRNA guanosine(34) transglycosylase Tgt [Zetaproteobacteria bacterium]